MRDAERIEAITTETNDLSEIPANLLDSNYEQAEKQSRAEHLRPYWFKPGQSGNPQGRQRKDMAAEIAQKLFENNPEAVYEAYFKALKKGSGFTFQVLSDRAYGKLAEKMQVEMNVSVGERLERAKARRKEKK